MKRIRAVAIIVHKERVVLLWRKVKGIEYFVFPGGGVEAGETLEQAVVREALEETSLEVKVEKLFHVITNELNESNFYICQYISGEPKLGNSTEMQAMNEANQYEPMWKNISELSQLDLRPVELRDLFIQEYKDIA